MTEETENIEETNSDELSLEELVRANYSQFVADRFLEEFDELPPIVTGMENSMDNGGDYYEYVKQCIADNHKVPSAVDYCSRFIKDGKYTIENYSEENFDKFIKSKELLYMIKV